MGTTSYFNSNTSKQDILGYNPGAPVVTVLENTIGNVWFSYFGLGDYMINSNESFISNKTFGLNGSPGFLSGAGGEGISFVYIDINRLEILSANGDDGLVGLPIEIRVYN